MIKLIKKLHQKLINKLFPVDDEDFLLLIPEEELNRVKWANERSIKLYQKQSKIKG